jgi:hypothetical protein
MLVRLLLASQRPHRERALLISLHGRAETKVEIAEREAYARNAAERRARARLGAAGCAA